MTAPATIDAPRQARTRVRKAELEGKTLRLHATANEFADTSAAIGTTSDEFTTYALSQLIDIIGRDGESDVTLPLNAALAMIGGIEPRNELEALLAAQMIATHHLAMRSMNLAQASAELRQFEAHGQMSNKFMRTFTTQMEALSRMRRGGEQVVLRHVHVDNRGGQAVIAETVNTGRGV